MKTTTFNFECDSVGVVKDSGEYCARLSVEVHYEYKYRWKMRHIKSYYITNLEDSVKILFRDLSFRDRRLLRDKAHYFIDMQEDRPLEHEIDFREMNL